jgi:hypothetical protein
MNLELPRREGAAPEIGQQPPQLQFSDLGPDYIRQQLKQWALGTFPNVEELDTLISVPTSRALWLLESVAAAHPDAFMPPAGSREFCHLHQDGSLHAVVDTTVEHQILESEWGVRHMYFDRGVKEMLIYAPRNEAEVAVVKRLVVESYRYASGDTSTVFAV